MAENKAGRGRPKGKTQTNVIEITNIKIKFIATKINDYNNDISYLKVVDKEFKNKLQPILSQMCDEFCLPIWRSDDGFYMVKVKNKWMPERDFESNEIVTAELNFHDFNLAKEDGELLQGYYVKLLTNDVIFETA